MNGCTADTAKPLGAVAGELDSLVTGLREVHKDLLLIGHQAEAHFAILALERLAGLRERVLGQIRYRRAYGLDPASLEDTQVTLLGEEPS